MAPTQGDSGRPDPVRPIDWVQAVRRWLLDQGPQYEQLTLPGMPMKPQPGASYRAFLGWIWTWARANDGTSIRVKIDTVAQVTSTHPQTTKRHFRQARESGWLVKTAGHNNKRPNEYALSLPPVVGASDATYGLSTGEVVGTSDASYEPDVEKSQVAPQEVVGSVDQVVGSVKESRREPQETPISRSVDQNNIRAAEFVGSVPTPEHLFAELLLSIPKDARPDLTATIRRNLADAIALGHTAQTIRDDILADLPATYGPGLVSNLIHLASFRHPQHLPIADTVADFIAQTSDQMGLPQ